MKIAVISSIFCLVWFLSYYFSTPYSKKDIRDIIRNMFLVALVIIWSTFILTMESMNNNDYFNPIVYCIFIFCNVYIFYKIKLVVKQNIKKITQNDLASDDFIKAKNQNYWDISIKEIRDFFKYRKEEKQGRIEVNINKKSKTFYRIYSNDEKFLTTNIIHEMNDLELTTVKTIEEIKNIKLYDMIFKKIMELNNVAEIEVDYNKLLLQNENIAEYFLMELWATYTERHNIGIGNLIVIAENFTQRELIGALDNVSLNSVKRHGAGLFFKYTLFKNLIPEEILKEEKFSKELKENLEKENILNTIKEFNNDELDLNNMEKSISYYEDILLKEGAI